MIAHESAHVAARDNLKRFAMLLCPDLVWVRAALERAWVGAAEEAADAAAAGASTERRLDLAEALLRVARLAPVATPPVAISAFYLGGSVDSRVRRLLDEDNEPAWRKSLDILFAIIAVPAVAALVISAPAVHTVIELLVRYLP
jgi:beta-lactamase regulating signal transducer with metallopeptidase domain